MIASLPLAVALSAVFVLTGAYRMVRWSATMAGPLPRDRAMVEPAHLVMSVAMLVMTWTWAGTAGVAVQVVLFVGFAGYFALDTARRYRTGSHGCAGGAVHALMAVAMVWMLAAMPLVMRAPVSGSASGHGGHAGHGGGAGTDLAGSGGPAGWAVVATFLACAALLATSVFWAARAAHGRPVLRTVEAPPGTPDAAGSRADGAGAAPVAVLAAHASAVPAPSATPHRLLGPRTDAGCHTLMSLAMTAMLLAMVAGW